MSAIQIAGRPAVFLAGHMYLGNTYWMAWTYLYFQCWVMRLCCQWSGSLHLKSPLLASIHYYHSQGNRTVRSLAGRETNAVTCFERSHCNTIEAQNGRLPLPACKCRSVTRWTISRLIDVTSWTATLTRPVSKTNERPPLHPHRPHRARSSPPADTKLILCYQRADPSKSWGFSSMYLLALP